MNTKTKRKTRKSAAKKVSAKGKSQSGIKIPELKLSRFKVQVVGDSPLVCHNWSKKAREEMLAKQMMLPKAKKQPKDPERDFKESLYPMPGNKYGFPSIAFKAAAVDACSFIDGVTKVMARGSFFITNGELVEIKGTPTMREDMVRVGMGTADIRFRAEFKEWSTTLDVLYNESTMNPAQIINMLNMGGFCIGVGEMRPQKGAGNAFGMFHVATNKEKK